MPFAAFSRAAIDRAASGWIEEKSTTSFAGAVGDASPSGAEHDFLHRGRIGQAHEDDAGCASDVARRGGRPGTGLDQSGGLARRAIPDRDVVAGVRAGAASSEFPSARARDSRAFRRPSVFACPGHRVPPLLPVHEALPGSPLYHGSPPCRQGAALAGFGGLPDHLNHERLGRQLDDAGGIGKHGVGHDADTFEMDRGGRRGGCRIGRRQRIAGAADHPRRLDHSGRGIEILDDAPAGGISQSRQGLQHRMDPVPGHRADDAGAGRRRARLRHPGAAVAVERRGRRRPQGLHRGPARATKSPAASRSIGR